jgi:hypothetical protein
VFDQEQKAKQAESTVDKSDEETAKDSSKDEDEENVKDSKREERKKNSFIS